jgi:predicted amidohydrolase
VRIAAVQHDIVWNDRDATFDHLTPMIANAAASGAELILATETFSTGFVVDGTLEAEPEGGASSQYLVEQAAKHRVWVGGSCAEIPADSDREDGRPANTFVLAGPDGAVHRYRKLHPFTYAGEEQHFRAGSELITVDIGGLRCTPLVCYDLRFADEFWARARDTDVYLVVANWPSKRRLHWQVLLQARAIENQAYVVGVNRVGSGGGAEYAGDSRIVDPQGELLATAAQSETTLIVDVTAARVAETRQRFPFLQDRRTG